MQRYIVTKQNPDMYTETITRAMSLAKAEKWQVRIQSNNPTATVKIERA